MSELFMECEEEELEPWQKQVPEVNLLDDDDDDEPIFIGELVKYPKIVKPSPPPVRNDVPRQEPQPQPPREATPVTIIPANKQMPASSSLTTITPQPVIINSQGFIVQQPQLSSTNLIATLGKQYPPGTSFTIVPAGQQHLLPLLPQARILPGVVHRPQVKLNNNVVTLSNVQSPAVYSSSIPQPSIQPKPIQIFSIPVKSQTEGKGGQQNKVVDVVDSVIFKKKCPKCKEKFPQDTLRSHTLSCHANLVESVLPSTPNKTLPTNKHILLVNEFYYGRVEGNWQMQRPEHKTNTTFKCQSCLKVLKNNIRFMNHMKHHLELEKQCSESWESHTTCQHCYRQYLTPFQLQCHVERAHSLLASSTNCKICELAFETEQVLLEHMKDTHKPGEMPYMCQVCNFRSSFFMEVEAHFKVAHNNTKDLLCPFCLKVLRSGHSYMQHYMKHQKKGIHRCGKCRLNFLTYKERVDHKINYHKTFKKPKALDGLPPGTKVTIRASLSGNVASYNPSPSGLAHEAKNPKPAKSKPNPSQVLGKDKPTQPKKQQEKRVSKKNLALKNTRIGGGPHTCIECSTEIKDFFSHYPMISNCGACNYQTSCKVSISNHMIRYHSTISKDRFRKMGNQRNPNPSIALTCLNCRFLVGALQGDKMSKHLIENPHHMCRVIQPKANGDKEAGANGDKEAGANGDKEAGADGDKEAGADGDKEAGADGDKEAGADGDKEAGADGDKEAGADGDKEAGATGDKEAGATGDKEAKEAPTASSADASFPPLSPLVGTLEEGSAVLDDLLGSHVGIDQVRELVSSLQEDLISSAQKTQTESSLNQRPNLTRIQQQKTTSAFLRQEQRREEQTKCIDKDIIVQAGVMSEEKTERKRRMRRIQHEMRERELEDGILKSEEERIHKEKQLEQEERMARELARISYETQRDEKMRQHIKENSHELRELESKLRSAYLNRERAAQIAEKETMRFETMREEADFARKMKSEHERASVEQKKLDQKHCEESMRHQRELQLQLVEKERKRQEAYEEFLKEKLLVDEIVRKIYEEDQMERQLKLEKVRATQQYIEEFQKQQAEWRRLEREKIEAENRRIREFSSYQQQMEETRMAKIHEREQAKQHLQQMLTEKYEVERKQREEMERVREELCLEEQAEAMRKKEIEEMEKQIRRRLMFQQTCHEQMAFKEMRKQAEKEEEEAYRQMMMAKFAEDDRIEQMNAQKRRMKQLEHKRAVEKLTEDRRQQHEADKELEAQERAIEQEREALRRQIIEEERQRLLKHHATKLLGYFPKGLFREDDLEHFDEEFRSNFQKQQADIFSGEDWEGDE
ncbi:unnamed protein product [Merluccius merluccius]